MKKESLIIPGPKADRPLVPVGPFRVGGEKEKKFSDRNLSGEEGRREGRRREV